MELMRGLTMSIYGFPDSSEHDSYALLGARVRPRSELDVEVKETVDQVSAALAHYGLRVTGTHGPVVSVDGMRGRKYRVTVEEL